MAQQREYRSYGRGSPQQSSTQRWRPGEQEGSQRPSGGWGERPYSQNEYRTEHPEEFERAPWQRGYGQDDREASNESGYSGPGSTQGADYGQGGYGSEAYGQRERGGYRGADEPHGDPGSYGWQRDPGRFGQRPYGQGGPNYGSGQGYGQGSGQGAYGQGGYGQGGFAQGGQGYDQEGFGQSRGYGQGSYGAAGQGGYETYGQGAYAGSQRARRGPKGYKRSDERLKEDISERLMNNAYIDAAEVTVDVQNGKVTLEGTVPERRMKHQIEDLVDNCPGVQDIENRVRVARGESGSSGGETSQSGSATAGAGTSGTGTFGATGSSRKKE
jgi:osmotically-inducible protein OsmY